MNPFRHLQRWWGLTGRVLALCASLFVLSPSAFAQRAPDAKAEQSVLLPPELVIGAQTTPRFRILYTARSKEAAEHLASRIEEVRQQFQTVLGRDWPGITEIRLGRGREEFEALALPGGTPPPWAVGLAYPQHNVVLLDAASLNLPQGEMTLRHELAHVALGRLGEGWPRWFHEGLAMYLTGDRYSLSQYTALFRGVTQSRILHFRDLTTHWPSHPSDVEIAYAQSLAFLESLVERHGAAQMGALIDLVGRGATFEDAFTQAFGRTLAQEEDLWRDDLPSRYSWMPIIGMGSSLWVLVAGLCVVAWYRRRRQQAKRLAEMALEDEAEETALRLEAALAQQEGGEAAATAAPDGPSADDPWQMDLWPDDDRFGLQDKSKRTLH